MREIKFRGRAIDGDWVYGSYQADVLAVGKHTIIYADKEGFYCEDEVDPETVGQYTGLKDRNGRGRDIYEGDIYKQNGRHYVVEWSEYGVGWVVRSTKTGSVLPGYLQGEISVYDDYEHIGNIHDHSHLLKGEEA